MLLIYTTKSRDKMESYTDLQLKDAIERARAEQAAARKTAGAKGREWSALNELGGSSKRDTNVARAEDRLTALLEEQKLRVRYGGKAGLDAHRAKVVAERMRRDALDKERREAAEVAAQEKADAMADHCLKMRNMTSACESAW